MENRIPPDFWFNLSDKEKSELYQFHRLVKIMAQLRAPEGCPWDKKQTHASLKPYLIEETYEVLEQLELMNMTGLEEELGDLLLQIVFHAEIAKETGTFSMAEVSKGIADKLERRHPHIFGDAVADTAEQVLVNWEKIKAEEKKNRPDLPVETSILNKVNPYQPALMEAQEIQATVAKVGFDWDSIDGAIDKVKEELAEVIAARANGDDAAVEEEIGDLFFAVVNTARLADCHSELALRGTNRKFRRRFKAVEAKVAASGQSFTELSLQELDKFWDEVKLEEKKHRNFL